MTKRYVGGAPRIKEEVAEALMNNRPVVDGFLEILELCVERQKDVVLASPINNDGDAHNLLINKARLEGAERLVADAKTALAKTSRS